MDKPLYLAIGLTTGLKCKYDGDENVYPVYGYERNEQLIHVSQNESDWWNSLYCKPIIRPLSDLTKPIVQANYNNGEPFVPIVALAKKAGYENPKILKGKCLIGIWGDGSSSFERYMELDECFGFSITEIDNYYSSDGRTETIMGLNYNQLELFQLLWSWHFWPGMPEGEEVIYVTENFNPYK